GLVEQQLPLARHGERHGARGLQWRGLTAGEVHGQRMQILERERCEHEGCQQEEHDVDHRDDLDAAPPTLARCAELHGAPSLASSRMKSTTRVPSCSISSITCA